MRWPRFAGFGVLVAPLIVGGAVRFGHTESPLGPRFARDTVGCLDTLHASDSVNVVVTISVKAREKKAKLPPEFEGLFVQEFRSRLKIPGKLPLSVMRGWAPCDSAQNKCDGGVMRLGSQAYATAHPDGTLSRITVIDYTLTPAFADGVRTALQQLSDEKLVPLFTESDSVSLDIFIHSEQYSDTVPAFRHLFRARVPHYSVQFAEAQWPKNAKGPKYPSVPERLHVADSLALTFTVLSDGTVAAESVDFHAGHYTDFIRAVFDRLATIHYLPGRIGSCPVPTWQSQAFVFKAP